jgi:hypothetical protein
MNREIKFTLDGKIVARFLHILFRDPDLNLDEPITDTYMFEIGHEIGITQEQVVGILVTLKEMKIIQ